MQSFNITRAPCFPAQGAGKSPAQCRSSRLVPPVHDHLVARARQTDEVCSVSDPNCEFPDPETKFKTYGKFFGAAHKLDLNWLQGVPRVRVRTPEEAVSVRQQEELLELAVLNEKLAGTEPWEARKQLEYLKKRRQNWERIFHYVTKQDAAATLSLIEEANAKVEEALSEESRENQSVTSLKNQLVELQEQVDEAQKRLNLTQSRVEQNLSRVNELRAEAMALERIRRSSANTATLEGAAPSTTAGQRASKVAPLRRKDRGLKSSLDAEEPLKNFWYPAEFTSKLKQDIMVPFEIFGEPWVLFRDERGNAACIKDECAHRACPLSLGKVVDGQVQCPYHGWEYNADGECTKMPSTVQCKGIGVTALPTVEKDGFVWVWPGMGIPPEVPDVTRPPHGFEVHAEIMLEVPVEHGLLMENLLDLAHAPFTHTSTFAKGWPIPDAVRFHAQRLLSGAWDPYPIDMAFQPPCMVLSTIGLAQPGKIMRGVKASQCERHLHQLHVCMPAKKGYTRLLYRMSLDFIPWVKYVPFIDDVWKGVAGQVLGEDLVLVKGQQDRLQAGGDTWANPVSYDKLAVRYRRWRNQLATGEIESSETRQVVAMDAGELFAAEETFLDDSRN